MVTKPVATEPTSVVDEAEENAQADPQAGRESMNIEELTQLPGNNPVYSEIHNIVGTSRTAGSLENHTPERISWTFRERLSQLGEDWLGNPFSTLVGFIPAYRSAGGSTQPPKEMMEKMLPSALCKCLSVF